MGAIGSMTRHGILISVERERERDERKVLK